MTFEEFKTSILEELPERLPQELRSANISIHQVLKNNNQLLDGLNVMPEGSNKGLTLYLNEHYEQFNMEDADAIPDKYFNDLIGAINKGFGAIGKDINLNITDQFYDYSKIKDNLFITLVNKEKNEDFLETAASKSVLNLAEIAKVAFYGEDEDRIQASITVTKKHLNAWGIDEKQLFADAEKNSERIAPAEVKSINDVVDEITTGEEIERTTEAVLKTGPFLVLSNTNKIYGASVMLYDNLLADLAEKAEDSFYILPSSVHEVLLIPQARSEADIDKLTDMVQSVNDSMVDEEDKLSDTVYFFDKDTKELSLAKEPEEKLTELNNFAYSVIAAQNSHNVSLEKAANIYLFQVSAFDGVTGQSWLYKAENAQQVMDFLDTRKAELKGTEILGIKLATGDDVRPNRSATDISDGKIDYMSADEMRAITDSQRDISDVEREKILAFKEPEKEKAETKDSQNVD